ncbi:MAG: cob(I)yrinic acid a,c-diamide adenosyltransferase [Candidatus Azobacteroides pseudotrichonymphae]|jgi:cob(I)alamin adenosyltransferase|uniref:corrinoid adenosyltransferase n=1 Tax=Azobacteroides pseudotrichonymphae genomovar. CFP2 TaxID=511995 RepID=B6YQX0_AZOPC|nr:cob(I)yrinic acid a,c-diamide adenosyltransferase [Candidatus Azobacteroides pseudotrichonymphae]MDR0530011.1 cob(I)yrinic acid a,c-diamide adenosyltransferase [Bacteroidales bacterium OttesenSCG-928-I14]BAG83592.1 cob(I)alamin adenosyltransferase [Candidatus Azobacteroides pseudotrichonymphae genomovar. CFP2]GMO32451.1 MAG: cob(I)yrinic acid a,c-diamide adenosyltransferase [Candidatus Azobacteroides pseudotrichonymphae]
MKGYIQIYTGNGKGKTTAALGLALRATGAGKKVFFAQFLKRQIYSEIKALQQYIPLIEIRQYGSNYFIYNKPTQTDINSAKKGFQEITDTIFSGKYNVIVLDEANIAIFYNFFSVQELIEILKQKPEETEIIITGRYAVPELVEIADLVTEMKEIKHYYNKGIKARLGIEY